MVIGITGLNRGENPQPGYAAIRSIRRAFGNKHRLIGLVYDPMESGIYAEDGPDATFSLPYPSAGTQSFLDRIDSIQKEEKLEALIPCLDSELEPIVSLRPELEKRGIRLSIPNQQAFQARNKHKLADLATKCAIPTPLTYAVNGPEDIQEAIKDLPFPLMVKGRYYGAKKVHDLAELNHHFHQTITQWGGPVLLQQIVQGEEYNLMGYCGKPGQLLGSVALKKTVINHEGKGMGGVTIDDPKLTTLAETLIHEIQWEGPFELEVISTPNGQYSVIEINPRFPAWVDFPSMLGVNLPEALINHLEGSTSKIPKCPAGKVFIRHTIELCCDLQDIGQLSATGKLEKN